MRRSITPFTGRFLCGNAGITRKKHGCISWYIKTETTDCRLGNLQLITAEEYDSAEDGKYVK